MSEANERVRFGTNLNELRNGLYSYKKEGEMIMHSQNYHKGNSGLLNEYDRSMYGKTDSTSKGLIDKNRTHLNYNLCSHSQYKPKEIVAIQEKIRGKKFAKNGNFFGTTIISLPKDYTGDTREFFESAYKNLKKLYGLKEEDIVSSYVHMDETTPHMHFCFIPVKHLEEKEVVSWEKVMTKSMFNTQHTKLSKMMEKDLGVEVSILNGKTLGVDITKMTKENKLLSMENTQLKEEKATLEETKTTLEIANNELQNENTKLQATNDKLRNEKSGLESQILGIKATIKSWVEAFHELKPKALKTHFEDIFKQRKKDAAIKLCEKEEETISSYLENNDLTSQIPIDSFGRFQRGVNKLEELLENEECERE